MKKIIEWFNGRVYSLTGIPEFIDREAFSLTVMVLLYIVCVSALVMAFGACSFILHNR